MKASKYPTDYILIKAITNSELDECSFAIIHINEEWKHIQRKRLSVIKSVENDSNLKCLNYSDNCVEFFKFSEEKYPEVEKWLSEQNQTFIELEKDDFNKFSLLENSLIGYQMQIFKNGNAIYNAFCKHTDEEFWTEEFSLFQLAQ